MKYFIQAIMGGNFLLMGFFIFGGLFGVCGCKNDVATGTSESSVAYCIQPTRDTQSCDLFDQSGTYIRTVGWGTSDIARPTCLPNLGFVRCRDREGNWTWPQATTGGVCPFQGEEATCPAFKVTITSQ